MANSNFIVQNGLTVGPLTIDAATGSITTSGNVSITGSLGVSQISKNDSSIGINDTGPSSTVAITLDGALAATFDASGLKLPSGDAYYINGVSVLNATTLGSGVTASSLTSVGTIATGTWNATTIGTAKGGTGLTAFTSGGALYATSTSALTTGTLPVASGGTGVTTSTGSGSVVLSASPTFTGTVIAATINAATIGNSGALLTGTLQTAAQTNITSVGTLTGLTLSGALTGTSISAATIGNSGALLTGTLQTAAQTNITSVGTLTGLTSSGVVNITNATSSSSTSTGALVVTGGVGVGGNLNVSGNLNIGGTTTSFNSNTLVISDPMIYIGNDNTGDVLDLGFVSSYTNGGYQHTGLVRDASDGVWKLFANVASEPTTTVDFTNATYSPIRVGAITSSGMTTSAAILPNANNTLNIGAVGTTFATVYATTFSGVSTTAKYADLAENYSADAEYAPGTVVCFGGEAEVTVCLTDHCRRVAGVVTTAPAYLMNSDLAGVKAAVALQGRVPCKVIGPVHKGDMMVSAGNGFARAESDPKTGAVIGKSLENFDGTEGVIEVVIGRV